MALQAGFITITVEYGQGLKDRDWIGRQDPYVVVVCGSQRFRSRIVHDGGKNPVFNQSFRVPVLNENNAIIEIWDHDHASRDDHIGTCNIDLSRARMYRTDRVQAPVSDRRSGKQHGILSVSLTFEPNAPAAAPAAYYAPGPASWPAPTPAYGYAAPPAAPAYYAPPPPPQAPAYYPPPAQPAYAPAPQQSYAAQQMGYSTYASAPAPPSAPPAPGYAAPPASGGYYPSVPTTQQYYPGAALPTAGAPPPPLRFY